VIDSHVHLIAEDTFEYLERLVARMDEHHLRAAVLFGSQNEQAAADEPVRQAVERNPGRFFPFLSKSADYRNPYALDQCLRGLDSGFWKGVGEIFLDCGPEPVCIEWMNRRGCKVRAKAPNPVPPEREEDPLYRGLFEYCGSRGLPVLVHCDREEVMDRTLQKFPRTTFIWAHVDHGFYRDVASQRLARYPNLYCEFGPEFRFLSYDHPLSGKDMEPWLAEHIARWRSICRAHPHRVLWGQDIHRWMDLDQDRYAEGLRVWETLSEGLGRDAKQAIAESDILRLIHKDGLQDAGVKPRGKNESQ
jgi:Tat protein secretion system quality control protein TatD with DNase activity